MKELHMNLTPRRLLILVCTVVQFAAILPSLGELSVEQSWNEEHLGLTRQINRLKTSEKEWRDRLAAEALDLQALVLPTDRDPLDIVLRRASALVHPLISRGLAVDRHFYLNGPVFLPGDLLAESRRGDDQTQRENADDRISEFHDVLRGEWEGT